MCCVRSGFGLPFHENLPSFNDVKWKRSIVSNDLLNFPVHWASAMQKTVFVLTLPSTANRINNYLIGLCCFLIHVLPEISFCKEFFLLFWEKLAKWTLKRSKDFLVFEQEKDKFVAEIWSLHFLAKVFETKFKKCWFNFLSDDLFFIELFADPKNIFTEKQNSNFHRGVIQSPPIFYQVFFLKWRLLQKDHKVIKLIVAISIIRAKPLKIFSFNFRFFFMQKRV